MRLCGHETFGSSLCRDIDVRLALEVVKRVALHSVAVVLNFRFAPLLVLSGSLPLITRVYFYLNRVYAHHHAASNAAILPNAAFKSHERPVVRRL